MVVRHPERFPPSPRTDALKRHRKGQNACEDYLKRCARQAEARENPGNGRVASGGRVGPPGLNEEILGILRQFLYDDEMDALLEDMMCRRGLFVRSCNKPPIVFLR